jgi:hypothetical protein
MGLNRAEQDSAEHKLPVDGDTLLLNRGATASGFSSTLIEIDCKGPHG